MLSCTQWMAKKFGKQKQRKICSQNPNTNDFKPQSGLKTSWGGVVSLLSAAACGFSVKPGSPLVTRKEVHRRPGLEENLLENASESTTLWLLVVVIYGTKNCICPTHSHKARTGATVADIQLYDRKIHGVLRLIKTACFLSCPMFHSGFPFKCVYQSQFYSLAEHNKDTAIPQVLKMPTTVLIHYFSLVFFQYSFMHTEKHFKVFLHYITCRAFTCYSESDI